MRSKCSVVRGFVDHESYLVIPQLEEDQHEHSHEVSSRGIVRTDKVRQDRHGPMGSDRW